MVKETLQQDCPLVREWAKAFRLPFDAGQFQMSVTRIRVTLFQLGIFPDDCEAYLRSVLSVLERTAATPATAGMAALLRLELQPLSLPGGLIARQEGGEHDPPSTSL
jgi:hypothetical protein